MKTIDFIEIGTSSFNTLLQESKNGETGLSIEPVSYHLNKLPNKDGIRKLNCAITSSREVEFVNVYYIPEEVVKKNRLPHWFLGCNKIGDYHPLHKKHKVTDLVKIEQVPLKNFEEVMKENEIYKVKFIKIDTEGHDCIIMDGIYDYYKNLNKERYPKTIQFETNENSNKLEVDNVVSKFLKLGFIVRSRGYDTILELPYV